MSTTINIADCIKNKEMRRVAIPTYKCHKEVDALPMTRGDYNDVRGWEIPENENPDDAGYLVVYNRGTDDEYVSWSPKHIFDDGYKLLDSGNNEDPGSYVMRMKSELSELDAKIAALDNFIKTNPVYGGIDEGEKLRMARQLSAMAAYSSILEERIHAATNN